MLKSALNDLERSAIKAAQAERAGMYSVKDASSVNPDFQALPAIVMPYYDPATDGQMTYFLGPDARPFERVRYLAQREQPKGFMRRKDIRYGQPLKSGVRAYFPVVDGLIWQDVLADASVPICITEGEKKALRGCLAGVPTIGLGGVYNFTGGDGDLIPDLAGAEWHKRPVYLCYDSDAAENPQIQAAEARLASMLGVKRRASVLLARIPQAIDGSKRGIDDLILAEGDDAFFDVLDGARSLTKLHAAVLSLNEHICWIEKDGLVYDIRSGNYLHKNDLVKGSKYSSLHIEVPKQRSGESKRISVANVWLTHELAQRYDDAIMDPSTTDTTLSMTGGLALNTWRGWPEAEKGDVQPFLDLTKFLCSELEPENRDFLLKYAAYKFQNPEIKTPIAVVLIGGEGSGKSMWADIIYEAAGGYGARFGSKALLSEFNGFMEGKLWCVIDEAREADIRAVEPVLRSLISESHMQLNEKFRKARQVQTYAQIIITSNERGVGAYSADNRRMFVIGCPERREPEWYMDYLGPWKKANGPEYVRRFLLDYDLDGWAPPAVAPMTAEKAQAYYESLTVVERVASDTRTADEGVVLRWMTDAIGWADQNELSPVPSVSRAAQDIRDAMGVMPVRPWYTPEELALLLPHVIHDQQGGRRMAQITPAGLISRQLRQHGVRYLRNSDDPRGFKWRGLIRQFLVVADVDDWLEPISQKEFDRLISNFPNLTEYRRARANKKA